MTPGEKAETPDSHRPDLLCPSSQPIGAGLFWQAIGCRAVGAAIVTTADNGSPHGFLALSATHLTASPPTIMVSIDQRTSACAHVLASRCFAVNYLSRGQASLYGRFTARDGLTGPERFSGVAWETGVSGAPLLQGVAGVLDCHLDEQVERHGTIIAIGSLVDFRNFREREPLIHFQGRIQ